MCAIFCIGAMGLLAQHIPTKTITVHQLMSHITRRVSPEPRSHCVRPYICHLYTLPLIHTLYLPDSAKTWTQNPAKSPSWVFKKFQKCFAEYIANPKAKNMTNKFFQSGNSEWSQYWMPALSHQGIQYWDHFESPD